MTLIYLYKKTHRITGLQYLGKTISVDPHKYRGSGRYWSNHINKHGYEVETEILKECQTEEELKHWGLYYSKLWNIVESKDWANLTEEAGPGGAWSIESKEKLSKTKKQEFSELTTSEITNRMIKSCHSKESWTPQRIENMKKGMLGKKKTRTSKLLADFECRRERGIQNMIKAADNHRGKTWKIINGKRVWLSKENYL